MNTRVPKIGGKKIRCLVGTTGLVDARYSAEGEGRSITVDRGWPAFEAGLIEGKCFGMKFYGCIEKGFRRTKICESARGIPHIPISLRQPDDLAVFEHSRDS